MPVEIAGVSIMLMIVAMVGVLKDLGMGAKLAPIAAIAIGVCLMVGAQLAQVVPAASQWYNAVLWGIAVGLMAVGAYSGAKNTLAL